PIFDPADNLDGTTVNGGTANAGTIYQLVPSGGSWTETVLHTFHGGPSDGANPYVGLVSDSSGNLYGVTITGGTYGYGIVFKLSDTGAGYSILYNFTNGSDGGNPNTALIVDSTGVLYGTTSTGGTGGGGTVFKLTPVGGGYSFSVLYNLVGPAGSGPTTGWLSMDAAGNIYGTTVAGGTNQLGSVFKLTPSGNGYTYTDLHDFTCGSDGCSIYGGVVLDSSGNLYGTASSGGAHNDGVIFEITP
ncbi:MAG TPA: choice-of-anchor tandem repeat GloVer-containing protein, partial [Terriglobales bacterium]|nr:choice-of-anchor tandem repeat GloVer-containing protein [Terriglobales bacterium]